MRRPLLLLVLLGAAAAAADYATVRLSTGTAKGTIARTQSGAKIVRPAECHLLNTCHFPVARFLGLPFGETTAGRYRFLPPRPLRRLPRSPFVADKAAASCWGSIDDKFGNWTGSDMWNPKNAMSEDCLQLNLWAPAPLGAKGKYPVLVWIFGGGFFSGSPSLELYRGGELAGRGKVVVVNINYRLGPFGFLYADGAGGVGGNAGLLDQQLALRWVRAEIGAFGGDPDAVTIFGESAGAASVSAHLVAPASRHLFRAAIMQSGTLSNEWAIADQATMLNRSRQIMRAGNCSSGSDSADVDCLRRVPAVVLQAKLAFHPSTRKMEFPFVPVDEDGTFFTAAVADSLARGDVKDCPIVIGSVPDEGTFWLTYNLPDSVFPFKPSADDKSIMTRQQFREAVNITFQGYYGSAQRRGIADLYGSGAATDPVRTFYRDAVGMMFGDFFFTCDVLRFADAYLAAPKRTQPTYRYLFEQRSPSNPWPKWMGVMHGYELEYFFGGPLVNSTFIYPQADRDFSELMIDAWAKFARGKAPLSWWEPWTAAAPATAVLAAGSTSSLRREEPRCAFWDEMRSCSVDARRTSAAAAAAAALPIFLSPLILATIHFAASLSL